MGNISAIVLALGDRGWSIPCAVLDELAFWRLEGSADSDAEVVASVRRGMIAFGETRMVKISTPYMRGGVLYDDFRRHFGKDQQDVLVWRGSSSLMNPTINPRRLERERRLDPQRYTREYEAEFVADLEALFDADALERCVRSGPRELPAAAGVRHVGFVDPSGGRRDAFTLAVGHRDESRCVVDCLRAWKSPFSPSVVVKECAEVARAYRVHSVRGDRYAGEWPREQFSAAGLRYEVAPRPKSDLYLALLPAVNGELVELPNDEALLRELRALERRRGSSGKDRVDHPRGGWDDRANAVAGVVEAVLGRPRNSLTIHPLSRWTRPGPRRLEVADGRPWHRSSREFVRSS